MSSGASAQPLFRRVTQATVLYGLGKVLPKVVGFLVLPIYTYFLTPADFGMLELAGTVGGFAAILMRAGLPGAVSRFYFDDRSPEAVSTYVTTVERTILITGLVVVLVAVGLFTWDGGRNLNDLQLFPDGLLVLLSAFLLAPSDLQRRLLQAREDARQAAKLSIILALTGTAFTVVMVVFSGWGGTGVLFAQCGAALVAFSIAANYLGDDLRGSFERAKLAKAWKYGRGVLPLHILTSATPMLTRGITAGIDSVGALGLFGIANRFAMVLSVVAAAFSSAFVPVYFALRSEDGEARLGELAQTGDKIWLLAVTAGVGVACSAPVLITMTMAPTVWDASRLVPLLVLGAIGEVAVMILVPELFFATVTWRVSVVGGATLLASVGTMLLLGPHIGVYALAISVPVGQAASALAAWRLCRGLVKTHDKWLGRLVVLIWATACVGAVRIFGGELGSTRFVVVSAVALAIYLLPISPRLLIALRSWKK